MRLPEDVRIYMATKTKSSVRELEGAFTKLVAYVERDVHAGDPRHGATGAQARSTQYRDDA